jgi:putative sterol carrier protein
LEKGFNDVSSVKEMIENQLAKKLLESPAIMQGAGVKSQLISVEIEDVGAWSFQFDGVGQVVMANGLDKAAHCTISTNQKTFEGMIKGTVNIPMAYMMRKLRVNGDLNLAIKVGLGIQKVIAAK